MAVTDPNVQIYLRTLQIAFKNMLYLLPHSVSVLVVINIF
jgi:hypothetical protein